MTLAACFMLLCIVKLELRTLSKYLKGAGELILIGGNLCNLKIVLKRCLTISITYKCTLSKYAL